MTAEEPLPLPDSYENVAEEDEMSGTESSCEISAREGELVHLAAEIETGHKLTYRFSAPLDQQGMWQTNVGDAGVYPIEIVVTNGKSTSTQRLCIEVLPVNQKPVLVTGISGNALTVSEGDLIELNPSCGDADGDQISLRFSGWMKTSMYQTTFNDAGKYTVIVICEDSFGDIVEEELDITVLENPRYYE